MQLPTIHLHLRAFDRIGLTSLHGEARNTRNTRQSLPTKPQSRDLAQIIRSAKLTRGMTLKRTRCIL